jgi:hypothetical protein
MVKCNICDKYYKRIDAVHLPSKHNITVDKYLELFPGSEVISKNTIEKYAAAQKIYASANPDKMKLRSKKGKQTITPEQQKKTLDAMAAARFANYNEIYGPDSIRNKKISDKTTERWLNYTTTEKSEITKKSAKTTREQLGESAYLEMMANKSLKGYKTLVKNGRGSKWEAEMISNLANMFPDTIADYQVGGRWYDAFIPSKNLLVEFDGDFWHPKTLDECQYDLQIRNYHNDQTKNKIALDNGFKLVRIRQSESDKIMEIR